MENVMAKPTILLEIDPFLVGSPYVPSFIHQAAFMAHRLDESLGGVSMKLTGSDSVSIKAEFRWQGSMVIEVRSLASKNAPEQIVISCPLRTFRPASFCNWQALEDVFDLAFLDIIEQQLTRLNDLKLNLKNRMMIRGG